MKDPQIITIIAVIIAIIVVGTFAQMLRYYFTSEKLRSKRKREMVTRELEETILKSQLEMQLQTMNYVSQEIHDNIGQILSLVNLNLKSIQTSDPEKLNTTCELVNKVIADLRVLTKTLNTENSEKAGLIALVEREVQQINKTGHITALLNIESDLVMPANKLTILFRMLQQVLHNIIKYSNVTRIEVNIESDKIVITENGGGFSTTIRSQGLVMQNLVQRSKIIGADVQVQSDKGNGTIVTFNLNTSE